MHKVWKGYRGLCDICIRNSYDRLPELSDLFPLAPVLANPSFQDFLFDQPCAPGDLGLALPEELAEHLLERFTATGLEGYCFPADYHWPRLTFEHAISIATQDIERQHLAHFPTEVLGPYFLYNDGSFCWTMGAAVPSLVDQGYIPGCIFAYVDKLDGYLWSLKAIMSLP